MIAWAINSNQLTLPSAKGMPRIRAIPRPQIANEHVVTAATTAEATMASQGAGLGFRDPFNDGSTRTVTNRATTNDARRQPSSLVFLVVFIVSNGGVHGRSGSAVARNAVFEFQIPILPQRTQRTQRVVFTIKEMNKV